MIKPPKPTKKNFWYFPEVYKMAKVLEDGRENELTKRFSIEIFVYNFENFLKIVSFSLIFLTFLKIFEFEKTRNFWFLQGK